MSANTILDDKLHWYKDAIIYEVHIKAYKDANDDGIGDIEGLLQKLDYLQGLGVTAIWLLPFYPSPLKDDGYDIADYYNINPSYGTLEQFRKLLEVAHSRNLKVITELVINHTSDQHEWFQRARRAPKGSDERNYYVWTDDPKQFKDARIIFQDFEASNWTWDPVAEQYYWHRFFYHQPDLNYDNPQVQEEVFRIMDFWCRMGVDGFRLDAVPYLFEREGTNCENLPETHTFLKKLRAYVDEHYPGTLLLAEANMWPEDSASYFGDGDECHMNYHFPAMPRMYMALQMEDSYPIKDIFDQTPEIPEVCQWAMFLRNHDELTLEMVTDEERDYMYKMYLKDPKARINLGIRHRLAPLMDNDRRKIELLNHLLLSMPGTPVIYYGDEIGMGDNYYLGDRDGVRTPMQWSMDRNAGFSGANAQRLYLPAITDPRYHYEFLNVELQSGNTSSLLWFMKRQIALRKRFRSLSRGNMKFITSDNAKVLAFTRSYEQETVLVVVNLSRYPQPTELKLSEYGPCRLKEISGGNYFPSVHPEKPYFISLSEYQCMWFLLEAQEAEENTHTKEHAVLEGFDRSNLQAWKNNLDLSGLIHNYMNGMRWFGGKGKKIQSVTVTEIAQVAIPDDEVLLLLVEVAYKSGLPDVYQLPVSFASGSNSETVRKDHPQAVICTVRSGNETGIFYDALYNPEYRTALYKYMQESLSITPQRGETISFKSTRLLKDTRGQDIPRSRILSAEQSNSSITYGDEFFLKIYRKVDRSINPDLEITRYLTEKAHFPFVPRYTGSVEWSSREGTVVLGMMQEMLNNHVDGWKYMLESVKKYKEHIQSDPYQQEIAASGNAAPDELKELLGPDVYAKASLLGTRTAEMHLALLAADEDPAFIPEPFSLHYQRSLFSSFQALTRSAFQLLEQNIGTLSGHIRAEAEALLTRKADILNRFRDIYRKKYDVVKIRIHGDYHLGQVIFKGPDVFLLDFEGEPARSYSERRLKRSALRDVAGMIRSFNYAAYNSILLENNQEEAEPELLHQMQQWQQYMSEVFLDAYIETVQGTPLVPEDRNDLMQLLQIFILEKAVYELAYELNNRPDWALVPIKAIHAIIG
ncbi:maltose alpha-D-glucosyltransferase [Rurimicrobium arvi]|uniref:Maltokinase n=1 Tax=Rurimicrobium arvi TaxID=2049916 RepID=A0ABP8N042_9BACT